MNNSTIYKKYIPCEGQGCNNIRVELYYSLGGINYFTYKNETRGYYLSICPVQREDRGSYCTESYTSFTGVKHLIKQVSRRSKGADTEATRIANSVEPSLLEAFVNRANIELKEVV